MIEVIMPKLGLTMEEGTIVRWLKGEGEKVEKGEPLFEVQTGDGGRGSRFRYLGQDIDP